MSEPSTPQPPEAAAPTPPNGRGKDKTISGILAILLGALGVHHFYLGSMGAGFILLGVSVASWILTMACIGFFTLWIPAIVGVVEGILLLVMSDQDFDRRYNERAPESFEFVFMKPKS